MNTNDVVANTFNQRETSQTAPLEAFAGPRLSADERNCYRLTLTLLVVYRWQTFNCELILRIALKNMTNKQFFILFPRSFVHCFLAIVFFFPGILFYHAAGEEARLEHAIVFVFEYLESRNVENINEMVVELRMVEEKKF